MSDTARLVDRVLCNCGRGDLDAGQKRLILRLEAAEALANVVTHESDDCEYEYSPRYDQCVCPDCGANRAGGHTKACKRGPAFAAYRALKGE